MLATMGAMLCAFIAMCMSAAIVEFRFPAEAMHKCGNAAPDVWMTKCDQVQLLADFPYRCCQANVPLPEPNIQLRMKYLGFNPATAVQSCGASLGAKYEVFSPVSYTHLTLPTKRIV